MYYVARDDRLALWKEAALSPFAKKLSTQVLELLVALHKVVFPEEVAAKMKVAAT